MNGKNELSMKSTLLSQETCSNSCFSFYQDTFCLCNLELTKVWIWKVQRVRESIKFRLIDTATDTNLFYSVMITSYNHILLGQQNGIKVHHINKKEKVEDYFIDIPLSRDTKNAGLPIIALHYVTSFCILASDSLGTLWAINYHENSIKRIKIALPFNQILDVSVITKPATRSESATLSGTLIFTVDKYSIYFAPFKEVLKNLEPEQFTFTVNDGGEITTTLKKSIFSNLPVLNIVAVPPDCLFAASPSDLTLYLMPGANQE